MSMAAVVPLGSFRFSETYSFLGLSAESGTRGLAMVHYVAIPAKLNDMNGKAKPSVSEQQLNRLKAESLSAEMLACNQVKANSLHNSREKNTLHFVLTRASQNLKCVRVIWEILQPTSHGQLIL